MVSDIDKELRRRWWGIQWRTTAKQSYVNKGITNQFVNFEQFKLHALTCDYKLGFCSHRKDRFSGYNQDNLVFVTPEEHKELTRHERRILSDTDVLAMREIYKNKKVSTRKLAEQFGCSQSLAWQVVTNNNYTDVK